MAKGMRVKLNYEVSRDPDTGVEVTRLTPPGSHLSSQLLLPEVLLQRRQPSAVCRGVRRSLELLPAGSEKG